MKKIPLPLIALMLVFTIPYFLVSCNKDSEDPQLDFDITIPDNWTGYVLDDMGYIYMAGRDPVDNRDSITESLHIIKERIPNITLQSYYDDLSEVIQDLDLYDSLLYDSVKVINGTTFFKMVSKETQGIVSTLYQDTFYLDLITDRYFCYENENGYNFTFVSVDTMYEKQNKEIFNNIINSFQFKQ